VPVLDSISSSPAVGLVSIDLSVPRFVVFATGLQAIQKILHIMIDEAENSSFLRETSIVTP